MILINFGIMKTLYDDLLSLLSSTCVIRVVLSVSYLLVSYFVINFLRRIFPVCYSFRNLSFGRIDTYFQSCGILRKYVLRNSSQSKKLKGNLPIGQLVSHTSKKATKANRRKDFSCSCRELSWKAHGVGAIVVSANMYSIGSDCHWLPLHCRLFWFGAWLFLFALNKILKLPQNCLPPMALATTSKVAFS